MATNSDAKAVSKTLTSTTADIANLTQFWDGISISNLDTTNACYVTFDGTVPVAQASGTLVVPAATTVTFRDGFIRNQAGVPGSTTAATVCHPVGIVGNGGSYSVNGVSGV